MRETGPSLLFEPVSCKQEQGFVRGPISSARLTSYRSHAIGPLTIHGIARVTIGKYPGCFEKGKRRFSSISGRCEINVSKTRLARVSSRFLLGNPR